MTDRLVALANGRVVGEVQCDPRGQLAFVYDAGWRASQHAYPLSLSMPIGAPQHGHDQIEPWLRGLLPDNENVLARWARTFQASAGNAFSLLRATGEDCAGAVQLVRTERVDSVLAPAGRQVVWLTAAEVEGRLRTLRHDDSAWRLDGEEAQFTLAGAQVKTALLLEDGRWGIPQGATPTTHILKPPIPGFAGHCENEHLCLALAEALGIPASRSLVSRFGQETAIVVERYDRIRIAGRLVRLHQETSARRRREAPSTNTRATAGPAAGTSLARFGPTATAHAKIFALW